MSDFKEWIWVTRRLRGVPIEGSGAPGSEPVQQAF